MTRLLLAAALALAGCSKSDPQPPPQPQAPAPTAAAPTPSGRDPATARKLIAEGAATVDVRTAEEYAEGHLPSAINVPVQELPQRIAEIEKLVGGDKAKPVVVYCASGGRSAKAKQQLEAAGYTRVVNGGGYESLLTYK